MPLTPQQLDALAAELDERREREAAEWFAAEEVRAADRAEPDGPVTTAIPGRTPMSATAELPAAPETDLAAELVRAAEWLDRVLADLPGSPVRGWNVAASASYQFNPVRGFATCSILAHPINRKGVICEGGDFVFLSGDTLAECMREADAKIGGEKAIMSAIARGFTL